MKFILNWAIYLFLTMFAGVVLAFAGMWALVAYVFWLYLG